jgi:membrane-bound lytic murein transglycosylase D
MRPVRRIARWGIAVLAAGAAACASAPRENATRAAAEPAAPTADDRAIDAASSEFELGREAALAGDFVCARYRFGRAIDALRPPSGPAPSEAVAAFSFDLYDGIQRYEALAGPTEEAGTSSGQIDPEIEAQIEAPETSPEAIATAREAVASDHPVAPPDVPIVVNDTVLRVVAAFQSAALHDKISAGLVRSGRYLPMIHRIFAEEGLPQDLAMIAFIESSFLPLARSKASAHGIWQFMPRTGRHYGLRSNGVVDERRDPEKSTRAAAQYLAYLHEIFGDWYLAMAAYNAGEGKILRAMNRTGAKDFWALASTNAIRKQTKNYVPAFLASVLISKNPAHYGFVVVPDPALEFDTLRLDRSISLEDLAKASGLPLDDLQTLNPELLSLVTPQQPEGYELKVPSGTHETLFLAVAAVPTTRPPEFRTHVAKKGDTLPRIARRYGVSVSSIASANSLSTRSRVARGQVVMVPEKVKKTGKSGASPTKVASAKSKKGKTAKTAPAPTASAAKSYRVKSGDTLYRIAVRHGTTVAEILAINGLGGSGLIKPGDKLKIPAK